jgi:uncharacterized membrane protein
MIDRSQRLAAKAFAITYLISFAMVIVAFTRWYAPILVWNDPSATARNIIAHESTFRLYLTSGFLNGIGCIVILVALYIVLRPINRGVSLFAGLSQLVYALMWFVSLLDQLYALRLMGGTGALQHMDPQHLQALAGLQLASGWDAYYIGLAYSGVGTALFSYLFFRSRYIPRVLAGFGIMACLFEGFSGCVYLLFPSYGAIVSVNWYETPVLLFNVVLCAWILIKGLKQPQSATLAQAQN